MFREEGEIGSKSKEKLAQKVGRREIYSPVPPPSVDSGNWTQCIT